MFSMENRTEQDKQTEQDKTKQNGWAEGDEVQWGRGGAGGAGWGGRTKCADEKKLEATECSRSSLLIFFLIEYYITSRTDTGNYIVFD
jgi:hypothetical protein